MMDRSEMNCRRCFAFYLQREQRDFEFSRKFALNLRWRIAKVPWFSSVESD